MAHTLDMPLSRTGRGLRRIAAVYLVLMSVQLVGIEGYKTSSVKIIAMLFMVLVMLFYGMRFTKAMVWGMLYLLALCISIVYNIETFRFDTVAYRFTAVLAFICFYNLVTQKHIFTLDYFLTLVKRLVYAYTVVGIIQQLFNLVGIYDALYINQSIASTLDGRFNSLSCEPSHSARILGALFIVMLRLYECKWGKGKVTIKALWANERKILLCFLWCMLAMQSGTAMMVLAVVVLFFFRKKYAIVIAVLFIALWSYIPYIDYEPVQRAYNALNSSVSMDRETIQEADLSASARILPYVYTVENFDLRKIETWLGQGIDTGQNNDIWGTKQMIGDMTDYGFVQYIFALCLVFTCCIKRPISIEALFFIVVLMAEIRNVYVWWAILMMFATAKYFMLQSKLNIHK